MKYEELETALNIIFVWAKLDVLDDADVIKLIDKVKREKYRKTLNVLNTILVWAECDVLDNEQVMKLIDGVKNEV